MTIFDCNTLFGFSPKERADYSLHALEAMLRDHGVSQALSCSLRGVHHDFQEGNDETLAAARERPWLVPVATIDPRRHLGCLEEVGRMRTAGVKAFRFFPDLQSWPVDFLPLRNMLQEIDRAGGLVFLPAGEPGAATKILSQAQSLSLPVVLTGATYSTLSEAMACLQASDNLYLDTQQLATPLVLETLVEQVGADHLLFGSRAPERSLRSILNVVVLSTLSDGDKEKVLSGNLVRLLEMVT